jgi:sn-glycerol 3-phosphate transport system substrate-binding protein
MIEKAFQVTNNRTAKPARHALCMSARRIAVAAALLFVVAQPARAAVEIHWWHAMQGEVGRVLEKLATDFNQSQPDYRIVSTGKGLYNETLSAVVLAMHKRQQPAIVQVVEVATATMMAAKGAFYPVFELMRDQGEAFDPQAYLPAVTGYYTDVSGNMLSFPFNASTPILYYNKDAFRKAGLDPEAPPKTWVDMEQTGTKLRASGVRCGFTVHWPSWTLIENFSAFHNLPIATRANGFDGLDTELTINNEVVVRHIAKLAEWQRSRIFDYGGRETRADVKFQSGECGMFLGTSAARADILAKARFAVGYGLLPYWPDVAGAPQNSIIGGASLWILRGRPQAEYAGIAKFLGYLSRPEVQARWHQSTGYLPITRAAYDFTRKQGFYDRNPGADISIEQITLHPPTENSKGLRIGSFVLIRDVIENELEQAFAGRKPAQAALDAAVARGNRLLRLFERAMQ